MSICYERNKELESNWLKELNKDWLQFCEEFQLKILYVSNESVVEFLKNIRFVDVLYAQLEAGVIDESSTIRSFDLFFEYNGTTFIMGAGEILGKGNSKWVLDSGYEFDNFSKAKYKFTSQSDSTFSGTFGLDVDDATIHNIFEDFELFKRCEEYEVRLLKFDKERVSAELLKFLTENKVNNVHYCSRELIIVSETGEKKSLRLDNNVYLNHFNN